MRNVALSSERDETSGSVEIHLKPCGPTRAPANIKPMTVGKRNRLNSVATRVPEPIRIIKSLNKWDSNTLLHFPIHVVSVSRLIVSKKWELQMKNFKMLRSLCHAQRAPKVRVPGHLVSFLVFLWACSPINFNKNSELSFYGHDSRLGEMEFDTFVILTLPNHSNLNLLTHDQILLQYRKEITGAMDIQTMHMLGALSNQKRPMNYIEFPGIPQRTNYETKILRIEKVPSTQKIAIHYQYRDLVLFKKELLNRSQMIVENKNGQKRLMKEIKFYLPKEPGLDGLNFYSLGCPSKAASSGEGLCCREVKAGKCLGAGEVLNSCTDLHYNSVGDFWYFWNPVQRNAETEFEGIPVAEKCSINLKDEVNIVRAKIYPKNMTSENNPTYPDYFALLNRKSEASFRTLKVSYLIGIDEGFKKEDLGYNSFEKSYTLLTHGPDGIEVWEKNPECLLEEIPSEERREDCRFTVGELKLFRNAKLNSLVYENIDSIENWKKYFPEMMNLKKEMGKHLRLLRYRDVNRNFEVVIKMALVNPGNRNRLFKIVRQSMQENHVFLYDGHSGLGGFLNANDIFSSPRDTLNPEMSQIFFFNGCSTFAYYNQDYFNKKGGIDRLDVLNTGIGASFHIGAGVDSMFLKMIFSPNEYSWPEILNTLYQVDADFSPMTHVNGDETNPRRKKQDGLCPQNYFWHPESGYCRNLK